MGSMGWIEISTDIGFFEVLGSRVRRGAACYIESTKSQLIWVYGDPIMRICVSKTCPERN